MSYGIDVPTALNALDIIDSVPDKYILVNTETSENGYFESIEVYASAAGQISLSVISLFVCVYFVDLNHALSAIFLYRRQYDMTWLVALFRVVLTILVLNLQSPSPKQITKLTSFKLLHCP